MNDLIEAINTARPDDASTRYMMGYDDGLNKAKSIVTELGFVSAEMHRAVINERDMALAYIEDHGIEYGSKAPDVVRVVRCVKCERYDIDYGYCRYWHGIRPPNHYCAEGAKA